MITLIKNDYGTPLVIHTKTNGKVIPLVGSDVYFDFLSKTTGMRVGGGKCEIIDPNQGMAKYSFKEGELANDGEFQGKVKIDLSQGARREALALDFNIVTPQ